MTVRTFITHLICFLCFTAAPAFAHDGGQPDRPLEGDMVHIPAGQFIFGTDKVDKTGDLLAVGVPKPLYKDEQPQQKPFLKGFYIDRHEVTNRRYKQYVDALGAVPPEYWENGMYPAGEDDLPVVWVSWYDASNFCDWAGKRLPTEKEWERAARGTEGREYPWGNEFDAQKAHLPKNSRTKLKLHKVGSHPEGATPEGVHDLVGNVWEWVADDYNGYKGNDKQLTGFGQGQKVLRGHSAANTGHFPGGFYDIVLKEFSRAGYRQYTPPDSMGPDVGFRCASNHAPKHYKETTQAAFSNSPSGTGTSDANPFGNSGDAPFGGSGEASSESGSLFSASASNPFQPESTLPKANILLLSILSLLAGLFSFLSPCTLPILPAYFAVTAQTTRTRMTLNSFAFFCGLASLFILMGASASFLGSLLRDYLFSLTTWGGILVLIFGVMTLFGKGFSGATFQNAPASTFIGYFLFGATFAMGWTPCVGPILSGILILAASEKTILQGMTLLFFFAVGLGMPLVILSAFCSHLSKDSWFWRMLRGKGWNIQLGSRTFHLHSTNLFSGLLLIGLGYALAAGYLTYFNSMIPIELQIWFSGFEEKVVEWLS
ncbi:Cytochrome c biogenesis protein transmembrane region (modular protein) [Nitrospina gracilis 3/211]|uniref:Cytochrome c biogenesis protein transmembrane region (Modular protein) n=1 Tax=Nitrospina gracilis (strain 3/211) TaxID=1266370 RepID=M1YZ06_NITG3|nr:Cytochrome c biogenesis protein transmembrane region (modular protein) [Nitrospina gracilis 3/211]